MEQKLKIFLEWAHHTGWHIEISEHDLSMPPILISRYKNFPETYNSFLKKVLALTTPDTRAWFNCSPDFNGISSSAFAWNEWEKMRLTSPTPKIRERVREFWDIHLPIFMSVRDDYEYYAIDIRKKSVVYSYKEYFEEPQEIAVSFIDFLDQMMSGKIAQVGPLKLT